MRNELESVPVAGLNYPQWMRANGRFPKLGGGYTKSAKKRDRKKVHKAVRAMDETCRYCLTGEATTADHVIPKSRGGSSTPLNLVGCCGSCNSAKGDKTPREAGMTLHLPLRFFSYGGNDDRA